MAAALHLRGAQVTVYDPQAGDTARSSFPTLGYATSIDEAVTGADVVLVLTEWDEFLDADPAHLASLAAARQRHRRPRQARRCAVAAMPGWTFRGLGRTAA